MRALLAARPTIALVGASARATRPSHGVMGHLLAAGYDVIPVNPHEREVLGRPCYPDLESVPRRIGLVDVFRRVEAVPEIARAAVKVGARALWLQLGVISEEAATIARAAELIVVMDRCTAVEHDRLIGSSFPAHEPEAATLDPVGLCAECSHGRRVPATQATYWLCRRSATDPTFPRYPRLPVRACRGFQWNEAGEPE